MSGMEMMIAAMMYAGNGGSSLGRDTMFAILMIVLNGLVGACLLGYTPYSWPSSPCAIAIC
jgi:Ca2+/H+ antiporter